ncbi:MAG: hypothetical protein ACLQVG_29585 [Terriglobia bacterium]
MSLGVAARTVSIALGYGRRAAILAALVPAGSRRYGRQASAADHGAPTCMARVEMLDQMYKGRSKGR